MHPYTGYTAVRYSVVMLLVCACFYPPRGLAAGREGPAAAATGAAVTTAASTASPAAGEHAVADGLRIYRDPATGRIGGPPPGYQPPGLSVVEQQWLNRSAQGLRERTLANGAVAVDLQGRFRSMAVATRAAGGREPEVNCTDTPERAQAAMSGVDATGKAP